MVKPPVRHGHSEAGQAWHWVPVPVEFGVKSTSPRTNELTLVQRIPTHLNDRRHEWNRTGNMTTDINYVDLMKGTDRTDMP